MNNARVIHGIISVPNRINIKRNQIFNLQYQEELEKLEANKSSTYISLSDLVNIVNFDENVNRPNDKDVNNETVEKITTNLHEDAISSSKTTIGDDKDCDHNKSDDNCEKK
jgi:hypothetical protein